MVKFDDEIDDNEEPDSLKNKDKFSTNQSLVLYDKKPINDNIFDERNFRLATKIPCRRCEPIN
jgi:hypothetical protein